MKEAKDKSYPLYMNALDGVIMAVNVIPDIALVIDAPSCAMFKGERVHGNHDSLSDLSRPDRLRIYSSNQNLHDLAMGLDEGMLTFVERAGRVAGMRAVLITASSVVSVTGKQYVHILDELEQRIDIPIYEVPSRDLYGDWLDGYADTLACLARELPLLKGEGEPSADSVAVVGYLMDRNEADHQANLQELKRLLKALGLDPLSIWLSGSDTTDLSRAGRARRIISLPHGRRAARILARRSGAELVEAPLPVGLDGTARFLECVGTACDREAAAEKCIAQGERETLPKLKWLVPTWFEGRRFVLFAEPWVMQGMLESFKLLGSDASALISPTLPKRRDEFTGDGNETPIIFEPTADRVYGILEDLKSRGEVDLLIGDSLFLDTVKDLDLPFFEFGCPSYYTHHLVALPYLGYAGFLGLAERFVNATAREAFRRFDG